MSRIRGALWLLFISALADSALAQPAAPASAPAAPSGDASDTGVIPVVTYAEHSFGFEIAIPSDWTYDRTRFSAPGEGGLGLCRGRSLARRATIQFVIYRTPGVTPFARWMDRFTKDLLRVPDTQLIARNNRASQYPAIEIELDARGGGETSKSFYYALELDPGAFLMIVYSGVLEPDSDVSAPRKQFEALLATLKIGYSTERKKALDEAMARGRALLLEIRDKAEKQDWKDRPLFFEIFQNGRALGYAVRRISRERRSLDDPGAGGNVKEGLRIGEESWRFGENGAVQWDTTKLFASFDLRSELMESESTPIPGPTAPVQQAITTIEQVIREDDLLITSVRTTMDQKFPEPREPVRAGPTYLGAAWIRVLPQLMSATPGESYAFSVYDPLTRGLVTHVIQAVGERELPDGHGKSARAFAVSEGYSPTPSLLYIDDTGAPLRIEAGDVAMTRITEKEVEQRYAPKREEARKRLVALQPPRRPPPPAQKPPGPQRPPKRK